jgi:glutamine synthetase
LLAALDRIEQSSTLPRYIPEKFLRLYVEAKRKEHAALIEDVFPTELDFYL